MNNTRTWEEYYQQYMDGNEKLETGPVSVEELNQMWIDMRENANNRKENLDWVPAFSGDNSPEPLVMSIEKLNEIYVRMYIGIENAEIKDFPIYRTLPAA